MDVLDPKVIAEMATRLLNEVRGNVSLPESGVTSGRVGETTNSIIDKKDIAEERLELNSVTGLAENGLDPERIAGIFESLGQQKTGAETTQGYYFLPSLNPAEPAPLSRQADDLVNSQVYSRNEEPPGDLKTFVQEMQSGRHTLTGGFSGGEEYADPFAELLRETLPATSRFANPGLLDIAAIRKEFPILHQQVHGKQLVWFDNAATTQKPKSVIDAIARFYAKDNSNIHRGAHTLATRATDAYEGARKKIARFLGAGTPSEIIFVRGTTEGINLVAQSYGRRFITPGDEIVLSVLEHHANIVPWQMLAKEKGAILRVIPVNDEGEILLDKYEALLGPRTRIVALTHVSNSIGTVLPIGEMIRMAKRYGAGVLIDGAQSVAHSPVDVQSLDADFFVFSGHKIFGPTGIGVLYGKKELLEAMPPWQGGGNMIRNVTFEETTYNEVPGKFEAGTPSIADTVGLAVALEYVSNLGLENIARHEKTLMRYATEQLGQFPYLRLIGTAAEKVSVLSFVVKDRPAEEIGRLLDREGIAVRAGHHCAQPSVRRFGVEATVRASFALYNTKEEIDRLTAALKKISAGRRQYVYS
jgi:cysteine desulfurase/selenocysteine lyase